jgi:hypothetical protein
MGEVRSDRHRPALVGWGGAAVERGEEKEEEEEGEREEEREIMGRRRSSGTTIDQQFAKNTHQEDHERH